MSTTTYLDRYADAVREALPDSFTVTPSPGGWQDVDAIHEAGAVLTILLPLDADKRKPVDPAHVACEIDYAAAELRRTSIHYKPEFQAQARAALDALDEALNEG